MNHYQNPYMNQHQMQSPGYEMPFEGQQQQPMMNPHMQYPGYGMPTQGQQPMMNPQMQGMVLNSIQPFVQYGLQEAQKTSTAHAMTEVAAISYLLGKGYDAQTAYQTVESWETNEKYMY